MPDASAPAGPAAPPAPGAAGVLAAYLAAAHVSQSELARRAHCSEAAISLILRGRRLPRPPLARRIEAATGGRVRAADLVLGEPPATEGRP